jgi:hypothetical protein
VVLANACSLVDHALLVNDDAGRTQRARAVMTGAR